MPHFLIKKPKTFSINFEEIENETVSETPFWEIQREEALNVVTSIYSSWQTLWTATKRALGDLGLSESGVRRLAYYESDQKKTVLDLLAKIQVAWEKDDREAFSESVMNLAHELRPSLTHFETSDTETFSLSPEKAEILKIFSNNEAASLKSAILELQRLSWRKFEFGDKVLTESNAKALIKEKLGLTFLEFLDSNDEPEFNAHGFFPSLLQDSADFGL